LPGLTFGVVGAAVGTRAVQHILFGVRSTDAPTYLAVVILVVAVVIAASRLPAHRASGTDPLSLLRPE